MMTAARQHIKQMACQRLLILAALLTAKFVKPVKPILYIMQNEQEVNATILRKLRILYFARLAFKISLASTAKG